MASEDAQVKNEKETTVVRFGDPGFGRPKGRLNKTTLEVRDAARALVEDPEYRRLLAARLQVGEAPHMETLLWHYAYGKPKEVVEFHVEPTAESLTSEQIEERAAHLAEMARLLRRAEQFDKPLSPDAVH